MKLENIIKHEAKNPTHAYLILGSIKNQELFLDKFLDLLEIAPADLHILDTPESILIEGIREMQKNISLKVHSSKYKIVVIKNAENLSGVCSNALLKTLEDTPEKTIIILMAPNEESVINTIRSRVRKINAGFGLKEYSLKDKEAFKKLFSFSLKEKFDICEQMTKNKDEEVNVKDETEKQIDMWLNFLRDDLVNGIDRYKLIKKIQEYRKYLKANASPRLVLENIMLEF